MTVQAYSDLIGEICSAAQANRWNEADGLKGLMDDVLDSAAEDAGILLSTRHLDFLNAHGALCTSLDARQSQSVCYAALQAGNILSPDDSGGEDLAPREPATS